MSENGWIKLHRKIRDNFLWKDKPFSKAQAWIDILLEVNHTKKEVLLGNEVIKVNVGETVTSIRKLCERWGWSNTKVKNFLDLLEKQEMLTYKSDTKKTVLKVLNYSNYQRSEDKENDAKTHQKHNKNTSKTHQKHTNKNVKNEKNDKEVINNIYADLQPRWRRLFKNYIDIYRSKNKSNTIADSKHLRLLEELKEIFDTKKFSFDGQDYELDNTIFEEGIQTIIDREVDNLNYAKKVWISAIEDKKEQEEQNKVRETPEDLKREIEELVGY